MLILRATYGPRAEKERVTLFLPVKGARDTASDTETLNQRLFPRRSATVARRLRDTPPRPLLIFPNAKSQRSQPVQHRGAVVREFLAAHVLQPHRQLQNKNARET